MQRQPVAELPSRSPDQARARSAPRVIDPRAHARILALEQAPVAIRQVHRPGNDDGDIGPTGGAREVGRVTAQWIRNHPRDTAAGILIGRHIGQPLREEAGDVHVERGSPREHLGISRPAETLVALRAVRRHVEKIAALTPDDVPLQLVEQRVRGYETPRLREIGRDRDARDGGRIRWSGKSSDGHVPKAMECEVRLVHFSTVPAECVAVRLSGCAQVGGVEIALPVEHLAEAQRDGRTGRSADAETRPAGEVLAEVEYRFARRRQADRHRAQLAYATYRWRQRCDQRGRGRIDASNRYPLAIVVRRARPAAEFSPRVIRFTAIDVRREHRTRLGLPAAVRHDALGASALIADLELCAHGEPPAIEIALPEEAELPPVPAIPEHGADDICARSHQRGDVIGLVLQASPV